MSAPLVRLFFQGAMSGPSLLISTFNYEPQNKSQIQELHPNHFLVIQNWVNTTRNLSPKYLQCMFVLLDNSKPVAYKELGNPTTFNNLNVDLVPPTCSQCNLHCKRHSQIVYYPSKAHNLRTIYRNTVWIYIKMYSVNSVGRTTP